MSKIYIKDIGLVAFVLFGFTAIWFDSVPCAVGSLVGCSVMFIEHVKYLNRRINDVIDAIDVSTAKARGAANG